MATVVDACGAAYPKERNGRAITPMEGKSLRPAFAGRPVERDLLAWEHEGNRAVRIGRWKAVAAAGGPWELYDIDADRTELNDRAAAEPARLRGLVAAWDAWAVRTKVVPKPDAKGLR